MCRMRLGKPSDTVANYLNFVETAASISCCTIIKGWQHNHTFTLSALNAGNIKLKIEEMHDSHEVHIHMHEETTDLAFRTSRKQCHVT